MNEHIHPTGMGDMMKANNSWNTSREGATMNDHTNEHGSSESHNIHGHASTFHFSLEIPVYLFENWTIDTTTDFILALLLAIILSISFEIFKRLRQNGLNKLQVYQQRLKLLRLRGKKTKHLLNACEVRDTSTRSADDFQSRRVLSENLQMKTTFKSLSLDKCDRWTAVRFDTLHSEPTFTEQTLHRKLIIIHILLSFLNCIKLVIGYVLMLIVMTFNGWMFICVVITAAVGYFVLEARPPYNTEALPDSNRPMRRMMNAETVPLQMRSSISTEV
ncbi:uncharacterized protein [Antedon mediterranea]|uniref:uncharacterized protein n=1 Tax=Antedon mediterranea TaxID=105859 RepID=UPI003AF5E785